MEFPLGREGVGGGGGGEKTLTTPNKSQTINSHNTKFYIQVKLEPQMRAVAVVKSFLGL